ncbi:hypothetical protein DPMN_111248 [Dreissena polymorpha]|uniref:Uncharacterized protein n=1 Tax=Dreissena polymorpha TaxID=45954 RepID=A0A9D4KDX9_DREPO|nr:hypothetical protein DPMN_111248 [Dreissena polymorpha]
MAPDTKVTDSRTDSRTTPKQYPSASGGGYILIPSTNLLTKFHEDWTRNVPSRAPNIGGNFWQKQITARVFTRKTAPTTGDHVFQGTGTTFELNQDIIKTTILTKLHEDWASNVTSTVFELGRDFIGTKLLTKFHEDGTRNVASRVFTRKCLRTDRHTTNKDQSQKLT